MAIFELLVGHGGSPRAGSIWGCKKEGNWLVMDMQNQLSPFEAVVPHHFHPSVLLVSS